MRRAQKTADRLAGARNDGTMTAADLTLTYRSHEELTWATAFHEAGHAVVGYRYGKFLREKGLSIDRDRRGDGLCHTRAEFVFSRADVGSLPLAVQRVNEFRLRSECMEYLAGYVAELRGMKKRWRLMDAPDTHGALELIELVRGCNRDRAFFELQLCFVRSTRRVVAQPNVWGAIRRVAQALVSASDGTLLNDDFEPLMREVGVSQLRPGAGCKPVCGGRAKA